MNKFYTILIALCGAIGSLSAQTKVQLSIPDVISPGGDAVICAPVIADSFPDIAGVTFSVSWDTAELDFVEARLGANPLGLNDGRITAPRPDNWGVSFTTDDLSGIDLTPGTQLFELCFTGKNASGASPLHFVGLNLPEFIQENATTVFPYDTLPGSITYGSDVATNVVPGDTNDDDKVDHTDLLNIGLLHGTEGPGRSDDGSVFAEQVARVWPNNLNSGVNHSKVDADGNGVIGDTDLDVVDRFYGQDIDGLWTPGPTVSTGRSLVPSLTLSGGPLRAGTSGTLTVSLGDGNDPEAVGYGLAFTILFDPTLIDPNSISVDFGNSFLGIDLLTIAKINPNTDGRLEIALSRKDQTNTPAPGGEVCRINLTALENSSEEDYTLRLELSPDSYLLTDQSSVELNGSIANIEVETTVAIQEPIWGQSLQVFPNPYTTGPLSLRGNLPVLDRVILLDASGRMVRTLPGNLRNLDLADLPAGSYLLRLEAAGETVTRPVVKR